MAVFRFLVNVDKCLDMSHYKCFFYKLKSRGNGSQSLFHLSEAQMIDGDPESLPKAVSDIRMYLDKFPYEVEDYRIIIVMRSPFTQTARTWEQTVLSRLLRLRHEFRKSRILFTTAADAERDNALNLVMLYDSDFSAGLPDLTSYFSSPRFAEDIKLLLLKYGIDPESSSVTDLQKALEATCQPDTKTYQYPCEADVLLRYIDVYEALDTALEEQSGRVTMLASFIREQLQNYSVYERFINSSDRREETLALLRLTDFINHDTSPVDMGGHTSVSTLSQRCDHAWEQVWSDTTAKERFANMLARYQKKLEAAQKDLDHPSLPLGVETELPPLTIPSLNAISETRDSFSENGEEKQARENVLKTLEAYSKTRLFGNSFIEIWNQLYRNAIKVLNDLKGTLRLYAQHMSDHYAEVLAERKRTTIGWKNDDFVLDPKDNETLRVVEEEKGIVLAKLKEPNMNPSLSFQDALNAEQTLEQANKNICFYLDCLKVTTFANFLLLLLVCAGAFVLHYTLLQPYALTNVATVLYYLVYIGAAVFLMLFSFCLPYFYYSSRIHFCLKDLYDGLTVYINGYSDREKYFSEYINHINRLDYLNRYHDLLTGALNRGHQLKLGQDWHRIQVKKHLDMLSFFSGLIETAAATLADTEISTVNVADNGRICDVADCPVYWP